MNEFFLTGVPTILVAIAAYITGLLIGQSIAKKKHAEQWYKTIINDRGKEITSFEKRLNQYKPKDKCPETPIKAIAKIMTPRTDRSEKELIRAQKRGEQLMVRVEYDKKENAMYYDVEPFNDYIMRVFETMVKLMTQMDKHETRTCETCKYGSKWEKE